MFTSWTWDNVKNLLTAANPHELVYFAVGYYAGVHYQAQVFKLATFLLTGTSSP